MRMVMRPLRHELGCDSALMSILTSTGSLAGFALDHNIFHALYCGGIRAIRDTHLISVILFGECIYYFAMV